jgi:DNA-binding NarL/FixJ family response regulator
VIVLDLALPKMNGLQACRRIKDTMPDTKVIIVTATEDVAIVENAYGAGASGRELDEWRAQGIERWAAIERPDGAWWISSSTMAWWSIP